MPGKRKSAVSLKVAKLIKEGKSPKQAYAIARNMQRGGRLGPRGGYKKKG